MEDAKVVRTSLLLILGFCSYPACGYDIDTHRLLSTRAAKSSQALGDPVGGIYGDLNFQSVDRFPDVHYRLQSAADLIAAGSEYEDTLQTLRPRSHFFDPQHNGRPLTIGIEWGFPSPDWALEDRSELSYSWLSALPRQEYSLRHALDNFHDALSGEDEELRRQKFGRMFQILGHTIHHIQDMAQPEHVRNDQHLDYLDTSYYEDWTDQHRNTLKTAGYPLPDLSTFRTARSFWQNSGKGIAEFTSHNFVSKDTNFSVSLFGNFSSNSDYPLPAIPANPPIEKTTLSTLLGGPTSFPSAEVQFIGIQVTDANQPSLSHFNPRASTYSLYSADLASKNLLLKTTTLNRFNFAAAHDFLIPRAVAYSAGLIDYFFRGRLALDSWSAAGNTVTLKIKNTSAGDFAFRDGADDDAAEFSIYYDAQDGQRRRLSLTNGDLAGQAMANSAIRTFSFSLPGDLASDKAKPLMLVFDGVIGEERGIAALAMEAPAGGFVVRPNYLPADGVEGTRLISFEDGHWKLSNRVGLQAGNVDWKGVQATDVLTWDGPASRYFFPSFVSGYSANIYSGGRVLATAPGEVLGTAIRYAGNARELLVATYQSGELRLYKRPFPAGQADARLYHPQSNPQGWRQLHASAESRPRTPFFFNASGSEGQTITATQRVRLQLAGDSTSRSSFPTSSQGTVLPFKQTGEMTASHATPVGTLGGLPSCPEFSRFEECTAKATINCGFGDIEDYCVHYALQFTDTISSHSTERQNTYTESRPRVVCVDYRGDAEILCTIARDSGDTLQEAWLERTSEGKSDSAHSCSGLIKHSHHVQTTSGREHRLMDALYRLKAGGIDIPLTGQRFEKQGTRNDVVTYTDGTASATGGTHTVVDDSSHDSRIIYLDVRNDIAVYEEFSTERQVEVETFADTDPAPDTGPGTRKTVVRSQIVASIKGQKLVPAPGETTQSESLVAAGDNIAYPFMSYSPKYNLSNLSLSGFGCPPMDNFSDSWTQFPPQEVTDNRDWTPFIHPKALAGAAAQGYAVDSSGNVVISQPLWKRQTNGVYVLAGQWNFISGGQLDEIVPAAPADATYRPLGVVR